MLSVFGVSIHAPLYSMIGLLSGTASVRAAATVINSKRLTCHIESGHNADKLPEQGRWLYAETSLKVVVTVVYSEDSERQGAGGKDSGKH